MASGLWSITNFPATATAASASQAAPTNGSTTGMVVRCRAVSFSVACAGTAQTPLQGVIRDGPTGTGTIMQNFVLAGPQDGSSIVQLSGLDVRASLGNAITVEFVANNVTASQSTVSAQGDLVPQGYPTFQE